MTYNIHCEADDAGAFGQTASQTIEWLSHHEFNGHMKCRAQRMVNNANFVCELRDGHKVKQDDRHVVNKDGATISWY